MSLRRRTPVYIVDITVRPFLLPRLYHHAERGHQGMRSDSSGKEQKLASLWQLQRIYQNVTDLFPICL